MKKIIDVFWRTVTRLDIILPAYNPPEGWEANVVERFVSLQKALPQLTLGLIVVNDGSSRLDEAASRVRLASAIPEASLISYPENRGKGYALRHGVNQSDADMMVYTDIDWPYDEPSMVRVVEGLMTSADAVIGVRNEKYYHQLPKGRRRISKWLRNTNRRLLKLRVDDTQAGLKGFKTYLKPVFLSTTIDRYLFDLEFVYLLSKQKGMNIIGVPVALREGVVFRQMKRQILLQEAGNFLRIWLRK